MKNIFPGALSVCLSAILILAGGCGQAGIREFTKTDTAMGTVVRISVYSAGEDPTGETLSLIRRLEEETLSYRLDTSEVFRINESAGDPEGIPLSDTMYRTLAACQKLTEDSGGAFDVTLGALTRLWDIDQWAAGLRTGSFQIPEEEDIRAALSRTGADRLSLEAVSHGGAAYLEEGTSLDLGAVGKGLALDETAGYLEQQGDITAAAVSVGGSVLTYGEKPDKNPWRIGIADPDDPSRTIGVLTLRGQWCISTSGDYQRYVEVDGVRCHHILDPATGYPAESGVRSVTVVSAQGMLSDALSTACFVLGAEKGMELAAEYGAEALFVTDSGAVVMTPGMEEWFQAAESENTGK